jgi:tRNA nucleotidyltransferase/poly(A) polymerase
MQLIRIPELVRLRDTFQKSGFDIRLVGGCVRDMLMGIEPKDIDLCTDATPEEQIALYRAAGVRFAETGLQHGTITVILPEGVYEITSLRTETDHDGRHATVSYTRDWNEDLGRRDLTINAMAMTFEGQLSGPVRRSGRLEGPQAAVRQ